VSLGTGLVEGGRGFTKRRALRGLVRQRGEAGSWSWKGLWRRKGRVVWRGGRKVGIKMGVREGGRRGLGVPFGSDGQCAVTEGMTAEAGRTLTGLTTTWTQSLPSSPGTRVGVEKVTAPLNGGSRTGKVVRGGGVRVGPHPPWATLREPV